MTDWFERIGRLAVLGERITVLTDGLKTVLVKVEEHEKRLTRLETVIEIMRPDGTTLWIAPKREKD